VQHRLMRSTSKCLAGTSRDYLPLWLISLEMSCASRVNGIATQSNRTRRSICSVVDFLSESLRTDLGPFRWKYAYQIRYCITNLRMRAVLLHRPAFQSAPPITNKMRDGHHVSVLLAVDPLPPAAMLRPNPAICEADG